MRILRVSNYQNQTNFQARPFITKSYLGDLKCSGKELGDVFLDVDIGGAKRYYVVRLLKETGDKILAAFYVTERRDARVLANSLRRAVKCAKTTEGNPIRFEYIKNEPNFIIEEEQMP